MDSAACVHVMRTTKALGSAIGHVMSDPATQATVLMTVGYRGCLGAAGPAVMLARARVERGSELGIMRGIMWLA